jgi:hypothetical protein
MSGDHNHIEVDWEVNDGYCGCRQQTTRIRRDEIESALDEEEVKKIVDESIQSDFENKISPDYDEKAYAEALSLWRELKGGAA